VLERLVGAAILFMALASSVTAQPASSPKSCEPGFEQRAYPHGSELDFRCRTRVIACPERRGYQALVILEPSFEVAAGVQFGYRCQYHSWSR
jgi:hypothetical protein